ncbi:uncharacterized protein EV420DRAFT_1618948 [Desarmillaria tabescens]|uniref:Uncharacterized protein n=1 Tax=Armillaria tabescens TaxID=1929756 RepID=A0AA39TYK9_ARMTA|nr:uncharacterized protein EV420DRAFT_1618948 [Desarmillaria tabescens]KAK0463170.1 hypothetical protein EV420DRAFT_1618948 [Desarmillaria tabescens]
MAHLCPVKALAEWMDVSKIYYGYLFQKMDKRDHPILAKSSPMTAEVFLELFCNNLFDIDISPYAYGTHSFHLRWSLWQICEWGGWSTEFTHLTIFFKLDREPTLKCWTCGQSCPCA